MEPILTADGHSDTAPRPRMVDLGSFGLLQTPWREHVATSDHDQLGKVVPGQTMQLDALPEELIDGIVGGEGSGYQLANDGAGPSAPPPLPPRGSAPAGPPAPGAPAGDGSKKTMILAIVVAVLMAVAGVAVGMMVLGEDEAPPPEPPPSIELGDIEVQSH